MANFVFALKKYSDITTAFDSCDRAQRELGALNRLYNFTPRTEGRINKAIDALGVIIDVLDGLKNIEEQTMMSLTCEGKDKKHNSDLNGLAAREAQG